MNEENIIGDVDIFAHQKTSESASTEAKSPDDIGDIDIFAHQTEGRRIAAKALAEGDANKAANLRDMSERFGENRTVAGLEIDFLNNQATTEDYLKQLGIVPGVARWMSENPKDAPIFKNDIQRLQNVQRVIPKGGIGSWVYAFSQGLSSGMADVDYGNLMYRLIENPELANDEAFKLDQDRLKKLSETYAEDTYEHKYVQTAGQFLGMMGGSVAKGSDEAKLMGTLGLAYGLAGGPVTAGGLSAAMGIAGMTGGMYKTEAGMTMATLLELGVPIEKARTIAIGVGGINAAIELLGGAAAIKAASPAFKALSPSVRRFIQSKVLSSEVGALEKLTLGNFAKKAVVGGVGSASSEAGTEMIQEGVNIAGEEIGKVWGDTGKPSITPEDALPRISGVGEETFGGAGVLYMLGLGILAPFRLARIHKAQQTKEFFDTLSTEVAQMEGAKLSPGATKEVVDAMAEDAGVGTVYIDGLSFAQSMRRVGVTIDEVREIAPEVAVQIEQASVSGSDVTMTTGDFAAKFSQTQLGQELTNHVRLSESDISPAEGKSLEKQVQEMRQAMEAKNDQADTSAEDAKEVAVKAEIRSVREQTFETLKAAGFSTAEARTQARLGEYLLRSFATSAGLDAEGVRRFAPTVVNRVKDTKDVAQAVEGGIGQYNIGVAQKKLDEESKAWGYVVDNMATKPTQPIVMLKQTPLAMHLVGADFLTLRAHPHVFDGLFPGAKKSSKKHHSHPAMTRDVLKQIPSALADPVAIFKDDQKDNSYVFMLDVTDANGDTVIVPVAFNATGRHAEINLVQTAFGRERKLWFPLQEEQGLLLYANSKKIQRWNKSSGTNRLRGSNADGTIVLNENDLDNLKEQYPSYYQPLSSRYPTAVKKTEDPDTQMLYADYETARAQPAFMKKNAALLKTIPGMASRKRNPESIAEDFIERAKQNLLFLFDLVPEETRKRAKLWYDGGRRMSQTWAQRYGIATQTAAAVIAVLSPQKGWFENVSMGERILDAVTTKRDFVWDEAMTKKANTIANDPKIAAKRARAEGKSLGELLAAGDYEAASIWVRCYDQAHNDSGYRILSPEGGAQDYARTKSGNKASLRWQSYDVIAKAISCVEDPRLSNISLQLGGNHKVRNFYNNIAHPELAEFATIDTHAVAAATLIPLAAKDVIVDQNFGGKGSASSAVTGLSGTYPFFLEAYKRAAAERGVLPREMQSITWEAIRAIYTDKFKTAANKQAIVDIWKSVDKGEMTADDARKKVVELAGGLKKFAWEDKTYDEAVGDTYDRAGVDAQIEVGTGAVNFEVAPVPDNKELTDRWNALPLAKKTRISEVVANAICPKVLQEFEAEGSIVHQVGGYLGETNPSLALLIKKGPQAMPIAKMLGYVLNQKSMMVTTDKPEVGTEKTGAVQITLPEGYSYAQIEALYKRLWELKDNKGNRLIGGFTGRGNTMTILNYTGMEDSWLADKIKETVADFDVSTETVNAGFPSKEAGDYNYEGDSRANILRDEATQILYRELDLASKQGVSGSGAKSSVSDNAGNLGEQQETLERIGGQDPQGASALVGSGAGAQGRRDQGSERGIQGSPSGSASTSVARREYPERLAAREVADSGIGGPRRRWENHDAEAHRVVARILRTDFERNGPQDYRQLYGRELGASVASRTARAVAASYRRGSRDGQGVRLPVVWEPDETLSAIYSKNGISTPAFYEFDGGDEAANAFQAAITASKVGKYSAAVYVYPVEEYAQMRLFLTEDKTAGFAIKKNGDIVSVFKTPDSTHDAVVYSILANATAAGGNHMDCFDTVLPKFYSAWGYRVVYRQKWNDAYAPDGWSKKNFAKFNNGEPDVCYLALDPEYYGMYQGTEGEMVDDYDEVVALQKEAYTELAKAAQEKDGSGGEFKQSAAIKNPDKGFVPDNGLIDRAKENFGTTTDPREAFFILPDGTMLDGSGRHWGGSETDVAGKRQVDHYDISEVTEGQGAEAIYDFMARTGAMRFDAKWGIASVSRPPTQEQIAVLSKAMRGKYLALSRNSPRGRIVDDIEFDRASKAKIEDFFAQAQEKADAGIEGAFAQTAYHGSPYKFDKFTLDHIGSGEGAQAHGWGLYFALDKGIAEGYRERLTGDSPEEWLYKRMGSYVEEKKSALGLRLYGNELADLYGRLAERDPSLSPDELGGMTVEQARSKLGNPSDRELSMQAEAIRFAFDEMDNPRSYDEFVDNLIELETTDPEFRKYVESDVLKGERYQQTEGQLYTVDIPEDNVMIREDAPFKDQPEAVQKAAIKLIAGSKGTKLLDDYFAKIFKANPLARKVFPDLKKYLENHANTVRERAIQEGDYFDQAEQAKFIEGLKSAISKEGKMPEGVDPAEWGAAKASVLQLLDDPARVHLSVGFAVKKDLDKLGELMQMDGRDILKELEWKKGSPKAAADAFRKEGVLGVRYRGRVDGECAVVWSEEAVKMREMLEEGLNGEGIRGAFNPATNRISLTPNADLSTFSHEMAHWYLENIFVAAKLPTATEALTRDVEAMLKDFGLNSIGEWEALDFDAKQKLHERFAYQFERYLAEGKAPSKATEGFFRRIGKWIRDVYRAWTGGAQEALDDTYKKLFGESLPPLSDEVRRVMDRMLESEDQVNAAVQAESLTPLFAQKPESMSDAEWTDYQASIDDSTSEAVEALTKIRSSDERWHIRARSKVLKEIQKKGKEVRDKIRERVARKVNNRPEALAIDILKSGGKVMGVANLKIDPTSLTWLNAAQIEQLRSMGVLKKSGVHVRTARSMLSPMARFSSDKQMIERILAFKDRDTVIEDLTTQEAMRTHSELFDPKKVDEAVTSAVHNEARERMLGHELKALLGQGRSRVYIAAAKKAADELLARTPLRLATVRHFLAAESRAAKRAEDAMKKGNIQEASMYKRQQLVQHNAARAVVGAQEMARRMKKHESLIFRKDAKLAKGYDTNILAVARAILANNGFGPANVQPGETYLEKVRKYDPEIVRGLQAFLDRHPYRPDTREMTIAELMRIYEDVDNLVALARAAKNVTLDGKARDIAEVVDEMLVQIASLGKAPYRPGAKRSATRRESLRKLYMSGRAMLMRVETWCVEMDGGEPDGVFTRNIFRPIAKAAAKYRNANVEYQKRLNDLLEPMWQKWDAKGEIEAPELGYVFERKAELIGALLHIGNASNKEKLLIGGRGEGASWADVRDLPDGTQYVSFDRWESFLARCFQEGIITKEDMDFVQSVWDLLEETKEMSQRAFRDYYGFYFEEVDAYPVVTPFGVYRGGYVPAATDPILTAGRDKQLERDLFESESEFFDMMPVRQPGWSKSRVKYNKPLHLNVGMIGSHLNSVVKFAHMANAVKNVQRVINNRKLKDAIDSYDPQVITDMLSPWLRRSATQTVGEPSGGFGRILNKLRGLAGMSLMAANVANTLQQYTGLSIASNLIGAKQSAIGLGQYVSSPSDAYKRVIEASEFMRARLNDMAFEFQSQIERMASDRVPTTAEKARDWTTRHAYFMQTFAQRTIDIPVWLGAFDKAVKDGMSDDDAVQYADSVIRRTQGSFDPESVSKVETGSPVFRSLLVFYSYFNMQLNLMHQKYEERIANKEYGRFALDFVSIVALPAVLSEVIAQAFGGFDTGDDDDWDAFDALALVISSINKNIVAMIPFIGNAINVGGTKVAKSGDNAVGDVAKLLFGSNTYNDRLVSVPVASLIENSWQAIPSTIRMLEGEGSARTAARNSLDALTLITGVPVSGLKKPVGYAAGVAAGEIDPESTADILRGIVSGKDVNK